MQRVTRICNWLPYTQYRHSHSCLKNTQTQVCKESVDFYNFSASLKQPVSVINPMCLKLKLSYAPTTRSHLKMKFSEKIEAKV